MLEVSELTEILNKKYVLEQKFGIRCEVGENVRIDGYMYCVDLFCVLLICGVLFCAVLHCAAPHCTALYCSAFYCKCIVLSGWA